MIVWLDDIRDPKDYGVNDAIWIKDYKSFVKHIVQKGMPTKIYFDHDLGEDSKTGYDAAKFVIHYCIMHGIAPPAYEIQSANPVGRDNIDGRFKSYKKFIDFN